jgi:thiol-disulfide isomerase/thioredoxin
MRIASLLAAALAATLSLGAPAMAQDDMVFAKNVIFAAPGLTVPKEELRYPDGSKGTLADYEGSVLIVTLWQEHCPFCIKEMPVLNRLSADMKDEGVKVVALGLDQEMSLITDFLDRYELDAIEPVMDWEKVNGSLFSIEHFGRFTIATPTSFIVDKKGTVVARVWGLVDWDGDPARAFLRSLVRQG